MQSIVVVYNFRLFIAAMLICCVQVYGCMMIVFARTFTAMHVHCTEVMDLEKFQRLSPIDRFCISGGTVILFVRFVYLLFVVWQTICNCLQAPRHLHNRHTVEKSSIWFIIFVFIILCCVVLCEELMGNTIYSRMSTTHPNNTSKIMIVEFVCGLMSIIIVRAVIRVCVCSLNSIWLARSTVQYNKINSIPESLIWFHMNHVIDIAMGWIKPNKSVSCTTLPKRYRLLRHWDWGWYQWITFSTAQNMIIDIFFIVRVGEIKSMKKPIFEPPSPWIGNEFSYTPEYGTVYDIERLWNISVHWLTD